MSCSYFVNEESPFAHVVSGFATRERRLCLPSCASLFDNSHCLDRFCIFVNIYYSRRLIVKALATVVAQKAPWEMLCIQGRLLAQLNLVFRCAEFLEKCIVGDGDFVSQSLMGVGTKVNKPLFIRADANLSVNSTVCTRQHFPGRYLGMQTCKENQCSLPGLSLMYSSANNIWLRRITILLPTTVIRTAAAARPR